MGGSDGKRVEALHQWYEQCEALLDHKTGLVLATAKLEDLDVRGKPVKLVEESFGH